MATSSRLRNGTGLRATRGRYEEVAAVRCQSRYKLTTETAGAEPPPPGGGSDTAGAIAGERDPVHQPAAARVVVDRVVLGAAIVPEGDRARAPAEAARELGADLVTVEVAQDRQALLARHPGEALGVSHVDVERFLAGLRVDAHDRMLGGVL